MWSGSPLKPLCLGTGKYPNVSCEHFAVKELLTFFFTHHPHTPERVLCLPRAPVLSFIPPCLCLWHSPSCLPSPPINQLCVGGSFALSAYKPVITDTCAHTHTEAELCLSALCGKMKCETQIHRIFTCGVFAFSRCIHHCFVFFKVHNKQENTQLLVV